MNKKRRTLISIIIILCYITAIMHVSANSSRNVTLFYDDFETEKHIVGSMPSAPWESVSHSSAALTVEQVDGNKKATMSIENRTGQVTRTLKLPMASPIKEKVVIKATMNVPESTVLRYISIRKSADNASHKLVEFAQTGSMTSGGAGLGSYEFNTDYNFMFVVDMSTMLYDVYVNDMTTPAATKRAITSTVTQIDQLEFSIYAASVSGLSSTTYIDNIEIYKVLPLIVSSYPADNQSEVMLESDMVIQVNDELDFSTVNMNTITDNNTGIIQSVVKNENEPNRFWITFNDTIKYDNSYSISMKGVKTTGGEQIADKTFNFHTEKKEEYWLKDNFQTADDEPNGPPSNWITGGTTVIAEESESLNRHLSLQFATANISAQKALNQTKKINSAGKIVLKYNVYTGGESINLTTGLVGDTGNLPLIQMLDNNKIVLFQNGTSFASTFDYSEYTVNGWVKDIIITLDTTTDTYTVTVSGQPVCDENSVLTAQYDASIAEIHQLDFSAVHTTGNIGIDDIKLYADNTEVLAQALDKINHPTNEQMVGDALSVIDNIGFGVDLDIYNEIDRAPVYKALYNVVVAGENFADLDALRNKVQILALVEAFNQSADLLIQNGKLQYLNLLDITDDEILQYMTSLSENGLGNVNDNLIDQDFKDNDELTERIRQLLYTNLITNNSTVGVNDTAQIINDHHDLLGLNYTKYTASSDKDEIHRELVRSKVATPENLAAELLRIITEQNNDSKNEGKSVGGGVGRGSTYVPAVVETTVLDENTQNEESFTDLSNYQWAKEAVYALKNKNVIDGKSADKFAPEEYVLREEFVKMIVLALQFSNLNSEIRFYDVSQDKWYYKSIQIAVGNGIVTGISENSFGVGSTITRQDMATMLYRAAEQMGISIKENTVETIIKDESSISDYAILPIKSLINKSVMSGYPDQTFKPLNKATRAEAVQMIFKFLSLKEVAK